MSSREAAANDANSAMELWQPPRDEVPAVIPVVDVIVVTDQVAIVLLGGRVFSTGLELQLEARARRLDEDDAAWESFMRVFSGHPPPRPDADDQDGLAYAVAIDGGPEIVAGTPNHWRPGREVAMSGVSVMTTRRSGHGTPTAVESTAGVWIRGLPADAEELELIVRWTAVGISEARTRINVGQIGELSPARRLWPR